MLGCTPRAAGLSGLAICCNGAVTWDLTRFSIVRHTPLSAEVLSVLVSTPQAALPEVCFAFVRGTDLVCESRYRALARVVDHGEKALRRAVLGEALDLSSEPAMKLIIRHPQLSPRDVLRSFGRLGLSGFEASHSGGPFLEVAAAGVTKASALASLCAELGINAGDVVAFGDAQNDLPMLAWPAAAPQSRMRILTCLPPRTWSPRRTMPTE